MYTTKQMIPVFDITRQNKMLKKELDRAINSVIESGIFILGPKVAEFEAEFAKYLGVKYAVGVASGTDAISIALLSLGVEKGDEVIMSANSYPSVFAVTQIGAIPKLVDINPQTFNIDAEKIPAAIGKKTKAILPVHLYGQPADLPKILEIGKKYKIPVVEDCAQAHGAAICLEHLSDLSNLGNLSGRNGKKWRKVGSLGTIGCFSFYPTKNLGAFGDGGMVVTDNEEIYKKVKLLRMYGEESRYNSKLLGRNSRLDELQAAILLVKLKYLDKWNGRRREIVQLYKSQFAGPAARVSQTLLHKLALVYRAQTSEAKSLGVPRSRHPLLNNHVYHLFVIRSKKRDQLKDYLLKKGIQTAIHYPIPVHLVPSMKYLGYKKGDFPESEKACGEILSLPMFPELTNREVKTVVEAIKEFPNNQ